jgi:protein-arginine kinase activator protein McsA
MKPSQTYRECPGCGLKYRVSVEAVEVGCGSCYHRFAGPSSCTPQKVSSPLLDGRDRA